MYGISGTKPAAWVGRPDSNSARVLYLRAWREGRFWPNSWYQIIWGRGSALARQEMWAQGEFAERVLGESEAFAWWGLYPKAMAARARRGFVAAATAETLAMVD